MLNLSTDGYIRYTDAPKRMHREHRMVARIAWGPRVAFPRDLHIHHMDGCRIHNCRQNLLILPPVLHDGNTQRTRGR